MEWHSEIQHGGILKSRTQGKIPVGTCHCFNVYFHLVYEGCRHEMLVWWTGPLCIDCCIQKVLISKDYAWTIPCNILKYPYPKQWYCTPWVCYNFWFFLGASLCTFGVPLVWITPSIPSISASSFWTPWAFRRYQTSSDPLQPCQAANLCPRLRNL